MTDQKKKWKVEKSSGGLVFKKQGSNIFMLMIMPMGRDFSPPEGYWTFPKGKIDENENDSQTALREVKEETGVNAKIIEDLKSVKFFRNFDQTLKFVHYYLMEYISGDPENHDNEIAEAAWFPLSEANKKLKFPHDKEILERAGKLLKNL